ncbi:MAG TPA: metallophosphoesterase [Spirochaetota bacterium]|nr:metallophosphoesterase [Spirochaetota bacterium]
MKNKRTIFIGDVQGCYDELVLLLAELNPEKEDRVIFLGDLINRGPQPVKVLRLVYHNYESLMGNQEINYLKHYQDVKKYNEIYQKIGEKIHKWISRLPFYIEEDNFIAVHAGLEPGKTAAQSRPRVLYSIRTWDGKGRDLQNPANPPWYEFYQGSKPVIYGHWAAAGLNFMAGVKGLDSGCVYGGKLTAYILETDRIVQVPARRVYYDPFRN